ncbi:LysM peptidoglycan-binding domain-containing protein [Nakamurella leprariae]|uniref:LysM peptidoglycan-binding domain-containing protein n=1 Tax=Nakamurella leprariae TaxID=2803911 RepID=A0A938YE81_9ACTN|nr:LysM domain-containing protein [Nakamurella leprariae]MBM9468214.1 LysM peptidoglycan-binding domain-containing protein [Nakamurella leprariae]
MALPAVTALVLPTPWAATAAISSGPAQRPVTGRIDDLLVAACAWLIWALLLWSAVVLVLAVLGRLPGALGAGARALAARIAPAVVRRSVGAVIGAGLLTSVVTGCADGPASAAPLTQAGTSPTTAVGVMDARADPSVPAPAGAPATPAEQGEGGAPDAGPTEHRQALSWTGAPASRDGAPGGPLPVTALDWPTTPNPAPGATHAAAPGPARESEPPAPVADPAPTPATAAADEAGAPPVQTIMVVTVQPGDSLWELARSQLPADVPASEVDRLWHGWYQANRATIGDDPDLIRPGQRLILELPVPVQLSAPQGDQR